MFGCITVLACGVYPKIRYGCTLESDVGFTLESDVGWYPSVGCEVYLTVRCGVYPRFRCGVSHRFRFGVYLRGRCWVFPRGRCGVSPSVRYGVCVFSLAVVVFKLLWMFTWLYSSLYFPSSYDEANRLAPASSGCYYYHHVPQYIRLALGVVQLHPTYICASLYIVFTIHERVQLACQYND